MTTSPPMMALREQQEPEATPRAVPSAAATSLHQVVRKRVTDQFDPSAPYEQQVERAVRVAQQMFGVVGARLSLFDVTYEWRKDAEAGTSYRNLPDDAFTSASAAEAGMFEVVDAAADARFSAHPEVAGEMGLRFYASFPIHDTGGKRVGSLRLVDTRARVLTEPERFILEELVFQVQKEMARQQELDQVGIVQRSLAPRPLVGIEGYELGGACSPARVVGGDFYDWYLTKSGDIAFTLGDVMGKGIGAAIIAATVRGVMRSGARSASMGPTFDATAAALDTDVDGAPGFVTLFHGRVELATGGVTYVDAGHGLSLLIDGHTSESVRLDSNDLPLGIQPEGEWSEQHLVLPPGATLVAVSDGVLDAFDGSLTALEEVRKIVLQADSAQAAADAIVCRTSEGATDDITALVIRRKHL